MEEEVYVLITSSAFYNEIRAQLSSVDVEIINQFSEVSPFSENTSQKRSNCLMRINLHLSIYGRLQMVL